MNRRSILAVIAALPFVGVAAVHANWQTMLDAEAFVSFPPGKAAVQVETIDDLVAHIKGRYQLGECPYVAGGGGISPTGERYVALSESLDGRIYFPSEREAVQEMLKAFNDYADGRNGTIYWVEMPELGPPTDRFPGYRFWTRLAISDKRLLSPQEIRAIPPLELRFT